MQHLRDSAGISCLVVLALAAFLSTTVAGAAPPWAETGDKPGNGNNKWSQKDPNSAPVIGGTPDGEVLANELYSFTPSAQDADNDPLTFSISNLPYWASFDNATGRLYGTPGEEHLGVYDSIRITVSDGTATASTDSFSVAVVHTAYGTVTVSWEAPTLNTDGTVLTDLAGFRVYYGRESGNYDHLLDIPSPGILSAVIDNLSTGDWYFTATALDADGLESNFATEVLSTVQ